jgi:hypothetical protein
VVAIGYTVWLWSAQAQLQAKPCATLLFTFLSPPLPCSALPIVFLPLLPPCSALLYALLSPLLPHSTLSHHTLVTVTSSLLLAHRTLITTTASLHPVHCTSAQSEFEACDMEVRHHMTVQLVQRTHDVTGSDSTIIHNVIYGYIHTAAPYACTHHHRTTAYQCMPQIRMAVGDCAH